MFESPKLFIFWAFFPSHKEETFKTAHVIEPVFSCLEDAVEWLAENLDRMRDWTLYETVMESTGGLIPLAAFSRDIDRRTRDTPAVPAFIPKNMMARAGAPLPVTLAQIWKLGCKASWRRTEEDLVQQVQRLLEKRLSR